MDLKELTRVVKGECLNYKKIDVESFKTDTKLLNKKDCFIALKGKKYDADGFICDDLKCKAVITDEYIKLNSIPVIKVDNTYDTLYYLTKYKLSKYDIGNTSNTSTNRNTTSYEYNKKS